MRTPSHTNVCNFSIFNLILANFNLFLFSAAILEKGLLAFPVPNGIKIGSPMQAGQVSDKHSLIEQLIWIQFIASCKSDHSDWQIYCPRKLSNGKVMMETTPHPVGTEFVLMFG